MQNLMGDRSQQSTVHLAVSVVHVLEAQPPLEDPPKRILQDVREVRDRERLWRLRHRDLRLGRQPKAAGGGRPNSKGWESPLAVGSGPANEREQAFSSGLAVRREEQPAGTEWIARGVASARHQTTHRPGVKDREQTVRVARVALLVVLEAQGGPE